MRKINSLLFTRRSFSEVGPDKIKDKKYFVEKKK